MLNWVVIGVLSESQWDFFQSISGGSYSVLFDTLESHQLKELKSGLGVLLFSLHPLVVFGVSDVELLELVELHDSSSQVLDVGCRNDDIECLAISIPWL